MPSDNNQEMFPIVDEQGNIPPEPPHAENAIAEASSFILSSIFTFSIRKEIYICRNVRNGKTPARKMGHSRWRTY